MSIFNDTNNSINEILEMLKNYRTEGKTKDSSSFQEVSHSIHHPDDSSFANTSYRPLEMPPLQDFPCPTRKAKPADAGLRLHSSL